MTSLGYYLHAPGSRMDVVVSDIDSTLADTRHRRHLCPTVDPTRTWDDYAFDCLLDTPIAGPIALLRMLHAAGYGIHLVSNRPASAAGETRTWLAGNHIPYEVLRLRGPDEELSDGLKLRYLREMRTFGYHPVLCLEDWPATAAAIEEAEGVPVLCVNPRYSDGHPG